MADIAELGFSVDSTDVKRATTDLDRLKPSTERAEKATDRLNDQFDRGRRATDNYANSMGALVGIAKRVGAAIATAFSIQAFVDITNTWTDLNSRVVIASGSMEAGALVMERIQQIARGTYSSLTLTAESYLLNARALRELGFSTNQTLNFTESLNNALVVSGAKGERAVMVQNAISKAMAMGALRGEELNTVIASGGRVTEALATGMGVASTELRALGEKGKITSKVLFDALISQFDKLKEEAASMPATIGDGFLLIGNSLTAYIGKLDQAAGVSAKISEGLVWIADNMETVGQVAIVVGAALLTAFGPAIAVAIGSTLVGAVLALNRAIMANPIGFLATALVTVITAIWQFRDAIKTAIGVDVQAIIESTANFLIQSFLVGFEQVKWIWGTLPNVMGSATIGAVNLVIDGLNFMIGKSIEGINTLINLIRGIPGMDGMLSTLDPGSGQLGKMTDSFKQAADAGNAAYQAAVKTIGATNYVGQFAASFDKLNESAGGTVDILDQLAGGGSGGAGGGSGKGNSALDRTSGTLQAAMDYADKTREAFYELKETLAGMVTDALSGFFSDLRKGVSVVDALSDAVGKLADKLMDMVLNNALQSIVGSLFGLGTIAGGAAIPSGGFIPGMTGPKLFAKGGVFGGPTAFDTGSGMGIAGEAGPEAILPLHRGANGSLGVAMAANSNFGGTGIQLNVAIYNNAANDVEATTSVGEDGSLIIMIDRLTAKNMADPASQTNRAVQRSFGVRNATKNR